MPAFLYFLHEDGGLNDIKGSIWDAYGLHEHHVSEIKRLAHKGAVSQIISFVRMHAEDLGKQILQKTKSVLKCNVDQIEFTGGFSKNLAVREDPSDIRLSCSSGKGLGWNIKFGSETRMQLAQVSHSVGYKMLGGTKKNAFAKDLSDAGDNYKEIKRVTIEYLDDAARKTFGEHPDGNTKRFVSILNNLISGSAHETMMAPRNYVTGLGGAELSKNIQKDFQTSTRPGPKIKARPDATVEVHATDTYVILTYKVPGGSYDGTKIIFWPRAENIGVKVTNLTSELR